MGRWRKRGPIFSADGRVSWMHSHAQLPIADSASAGITRVYFGTRDRENHTVTAFVEVEARDLSKVRSVAATPALGLGPRGAFDDSGAMPSWIVDHEGTKYLFYTGWNVGVSVPYRNAIGVATSANGGRTFERPFAGPILDRTTQEPYFCGAPCVLIDGGRWRMWYLSCTKWELVDGRPEPFYDIKYAESVDGVAWKRSGRPCVPLHPSEAGLARASVLREGDRYRMWYCYRGSRGYRGDSAASYRIGYAESSDGEDWTRRDECVELDRGAPGEWDSEMMCYPFVYRQEGVMTLLYNGNGFGRSGFGWATATAGGDRRENLENGGG